MSIDENKALVRRFYEEIDKGNLAAMDELVAENYIDHSPPPFPGLASGRAGVKQAFEIFWTATPGTHENGMLAEKWSNKDELGFMRQLGLIPGN